jgi:tetratricopeptide (TPR) repeat protein
VFSLFFTTRADRGRRKPSPEADQRPSKREVLVTCSLILLWVVLMLFGVVSYLNPKWLQELSRPGIRVEARDYKDYGDDQLRRQEYWMAIAQYEQSLRIEPDQVGVLVNLAIAYSRAGNSGRGIEILKGALMKEGSRANKVALYYNLGDLLARQGEMDEALEQYREALSFAVRQDRVYERIGSIHLAAKRYKEAREAFELVLAKQLDPCLSYRDMLQQSVDHYKDRAVHLAVIEEQLARDIRAEDLARYDLEVIRRMQQSDLEIARTHDRLAMVCAQLGDIPAAIEHLEKLLDIIPDDTTAKENLKRLRPS